MSGGTMGDPGRCDRAKAALVGFGAVYGFSELAPMVIKTEQGSIAAKHKWLRGVIPLLPASISMYGISTIAKRAHFYVPSNMFTAIKDVWQDCNGGGWLKKHLDSAKAKIQVGVEKAKSLVPQPAPELVPIPISSYAVSAEAVARRATGPSAMAKGVAIVGAATALAAISAALSVFGFREVPMMEVAPAGFGVTTDRFSSASDQNRPL